MFPYFCKYLIEYGKSRGEEISIATLDSSWDQILTSLGLGEVRAAVEAIVLLKNAPKNKLTGT